MTVRRSCAAVGVLIVLGLAVLPGQQAQPRTYRPVTAERLKNPDAADWLMVRRTYDGWGYSPLDKSLRPMSPGSSGCGRLPRIRRTGTRRRRS